ncbi:Protein-N(pi)-phosphohistidine--sugar phosphotransferase [Alteripontixanthobacter maritimus]|uniref:Protein-N(Pi)-phosphohistidine--sugar phosphotransferase n=1 Tax=Alteripontixanthobacter maritimus TaxID=2161824 RepID=A0A369QE18_9SPHN|nr:PTS sugar transporter subunit IIA [Alteripontixanthobacter maritimus]RDC61159.1 Protein-N(pi)-phosphohistidine--sugar phosphotransferase [Alteripontixanthobacter maritimus]
MTLNFRLEPHAVRTVDCADKAAVLSEMAALLAYSYGHCEADVLDGLNEREMLGSTGFGRGVALPHARLAGVEAPVAALLRLSSPVEFEAADALPVNLVVGLLSSPTAGAAHLHALAAISRIVRDDARRTQMIEAADEETLVALLTNAPERAVA